MEFARACGAMVPSTGLFRVDEAPGVPDAFRDSGAEFFYTIHRFDRRGGERIHIEDMNQVLNQRAAEKYRGTSVEALGRLFGRLCGRLDAEEYIRRTIINIVLGNEDAHLKNWSLIYPDGISPRLAPLYDCLSTVMVPGLVREHALRFGHEKLASHYGRDLLVSLGEAMNIPEATVDSIYHNVIRGARIAEPVLRDQSPLTGEEWGRLDRYRGAVPLARPLLQGSI